MIGLRYETFRSLGQNIAHAILLFTFNGSSAIIVLYHQRGHGILQSQLHSPNPLPLGLNKTSGANQ